MYDFNNLSKLSKISELAPETMKKYGEMSASALSEGVISKKYKELMAVSVAIAIQCPYCIEHHRREAIKASATQEELTEAALVAAGIKAGSGVTYTTHLFT